MIQPELSILGRVIRRRVTTSVRIWSEGWSSRILASLIANEGWNSIADFGGKSNIFFGGKSNSEAHYLNKTCFKNIFFSVDEHCVKLTHTIAREQIQIWIMSNLIISTLSIEFDIKDKYFAFMLNEVVCGTKIVILQLNKIIGCMWNHKHEWEMQNATIVIRYCKSATWSCGKKENYRKLLKLDFDDRH
jgi:hypothetical protein